MKKLNSITSMAFIALAISSIFTTSNLATLALNEGQLIFLLFVTTLIFFIPLAGAVGELSTSGVWGTNVFSWVKSAFGEKIGFAAIFWEWFQAIIVSVAMLYFVIGILSYTISFSQIDSNSMYRAILCVIFYIAMILLQIFKPDLLIKIQAFGFWGCVVVPIFIMFFLATIYTFKEVDLVLAVKNSSFVPPLSLKSVLLLVPFVLSLTGLEACGPFIDRLNDVKKEFPKAILVIIITVVLTNLVGSGAIAMIFSPSEISLSRGFIDTLDFLFRYFHLPVEFVKFLGFIIILGLLPKISDWILSPALALQKSAEMGLIPKVFIYKNTAGTPTFILLLQTFIFVVITSILSLSKSSNTAFLIAIYLDVAIYSCVYGLIFFSYIKLTSSNKLIKSTMEIPTKLKLTTGILGVLCMTLVLIASFFPPNTLPDDEKTLYLNILILCFTFSIFAPFIFQYFYQKKEVIKK